MATLTDYRGLKVVAPDPTGAGGLAIQNDLKELADRIAAGRYLDGLNLSFTGPSSVSIGAGSAISFDGSYNLSVASSLSVNIAANGANGLDGGAEQPRRVYYVYLIGDSGRTNPVAGLLSASDTAPALPPGYNVFRRIGFVVNDASSNFLSFEWSRRTCHFTVSEDRTRVLANGGATAFTTIDCSPLVPRSARRILLRVHFINNEPAGLFGLVPRASRRHVRFRAAGSTHDGSLYMFGEGLGTNAGIISQMQIPCSENQRVDYRVSNSGAVVSLSVVAVEDEL
jgi:hypothetical protein